MCTKREQALAHLNSARSQFVESDDEIIRAHVLAAIKLLEEAETVDVSPDDVPWIETIDAEVG